MNFGFGTRRPTRQQTSTNSSASLVTGRQASPDDISDDLDHLSSSQYNTRRKELMQLIGDLQSMGAQTAGIDIPSIVVIGSQSAGKSSLVEAVSGINVPRDSGTCTRCPMQCTMSSNATSWSCDIKLRFEYDSDGHALNTSNEIAFGPAITDRNEVDVWLRRAQAAILNPNLPPDSFYGKSMQDLKDFTNLLKFSRNVVSVLIKDPGVTDLSFIDLPGLIQNEDREVVDLVKQLTQSSISRPNTIILTTIPMSDEMENQLSVTLAREADPEGERTIGILTKPDLVLDGAIDSKKRWLDVIEGRQHKLKHGYYCVLLPDDAKRAQHLSRAELVRIAADFFDKTSPWSEVTNRGSFGIPAFVTDVSVLLVKHINKVLPQLRENVEKLLASNMEKLRALPEPLSLDPQTEVFTRVGEFCNAFRSAVSGTNPDKGLAQRNRALYTMFAQSIRGTAPDFRPFEDPDEHPRIPAGTLEPEEVTAIANEKVETMGVYDVRDTIKESIGWELPGYVPYEARARLINQFTVLWFPPAEACLTSINDVLDDVIEKLVKKYFGRFRVLQDLVSNFIRPDIEEHKSRALTAIKETLELEIAPNYTLNEHDYRDLREKWLSKYRYARRNAADTYSSGVDVLSTHRPSKTHSGHRHEPTCSPEIEALQYLARAGYTGLTVDDLARLSPRDQQFDDELTVMADVRAFFTIASKRIIDHVPLKIEHSLHQALANRLSISLIQRLLMDATSAGKFVDRMKELVSEDPATEKERAQLEAARNRLQEIRKRLVSIAA